MLYSVNVTQRRHQCGVEPIYGWENALEPAYLRIADALRSEIRTGTLEPNGLIPPERELCEEHGVSRMTARRALTILEDEGMVYRDGSRGTFVAEPRMSLRVGSFSEEVEKLGHVPSDHVIWAESRPANAEVSQGLNVEEGSEVAAIRRLRRVNQVPIAVETSFYPEDLVPDMLASDLSGSLWKAIAQRYGLSVHFTTATMEVVSLPSDVARLLTVRRGAQGMQLTRTSEDPVGKRIEYAVDLYRADRVSLIIDRTLN